MDLSTTEPLSEQHFFSKNTGSNNNLSPTTPNSTTSTTTEHILELFKQIANGNHGTSNNNNSNSSSGKAGSNGMASGSLNMPSPLSEQPSIDLSPPPSSSSSFHFPSPSAIQQQLQFQFDTAALMAAASVASQNSSGAHCLTPFSHNTTPLLSPSCLSAVPSRLTAFGHNQAAEKAGGGSGGSKDENAAAASRKRPFGMVDGGNGLQQMGGGAGGGGGSSGGDSDSPQPSKQNAQFSPTKMESQFRSFFPSNPCSDLLLAAAAAAASANSNGINHHSSPLASPIDFSNLKPLTPMGGGGGGGVRFGGGHTPLTPHHSGGGHTSHTKKLRGIITRADFLEKIERAESLEDCKNIFLSILDVILPGKASQNVAVNIPMQKNFDLTRIGPKVVRINDDKDEFDLHKLFSDFWVSKSHLSVKNIPSAFTRFVLSKVLGDEISKYTYCKLNNGKRGYKQLSNDFVKAITEFVAEGFGITENDTSSRIALRNAVENVIINTCGNARKRVTNT